ncbi:MULTISPECIES: flagellar protein export ATPase FliI [unclassified Clostridioides]|uniref:flagellar protein export ATPase FliI n=1 Tax=unclassified Clostridioides TaxID=2635829 RepID=UPI001D1271E5|nr:flagellar protein export ATPase FliI [Clostridioides sp. ZZV15-6388]MCC0644141.1 flagellar protein export ATPase FliI [Clostridioides sp. ZZV14-6150]MCC0661028.1 flagellar protein export ATPase FliI [Clostridioides sp. ZZV14-6154]MCC0663347.1 flagellar protein export ATPase FliI [Clostridioides sp. ZZV15-6597]MCC0668256.1 flagellar protein export ATPase FliI [Clostridioides sp. ZZV14-6153]MCC0718135.1 flagellar protein export ATPase FliI [Clostridioides sp. ZZV14-6105]MCC0722551.1 flagella
MYKTDISIDFDKINKKIENLELTISEGRVKKIIGLTVEVEGIKAFVGELCVIYNQVNKTVNCEVVGFKDKEVILMALGELTLIAPGCKVISKGIPLSVMCSDNLLGKVLDGLGNPIDNSEVVLGDRYNLNNEPPDPMKRKKIRNIMETGVRAIDAFTTCGEGQRIGIFAGSGVGKSTTLGMIARNAKADVNVIALVGERGREVLDFIDKDLGEEGMKKSVVVCATSDKAPLVRLKGALTATAIAEYFRDQGKKVILMMDSVTRFAMAQREVGIAIGEPPAQKGYTPSVFAILPKLMERTGTSDKGSITAFYTVLVDGDDFNEPIADTTRGILDGHIVLSRDLANKNHYPSIDVLNSLSRLMNEIASKEDIKIASFARDMLSEYREAEDLINIGAYASGTNKKIDEAIYYHEHIINFLKQGINEKSSFNETISSLKRIFE